MLSSTSIYKRKIVYGGVLPFRRKRLHRIQMENNFNTTSGFHFDEDEYTKTVVVYFTNNNHTWNMIKDLVLEAKTIFEEKFESSQSSGSSHDSDKSYIADIDPMFRSIQVLTEKVNYGNIILNEEDKKALVHVINEIIRSKYYAKTTKLRIITELIKLDPLFHTHKFLK